MPQLQTEGGFLFIWVINYKYKWTLDLFEKWGYKWVRGEIRDWGRNGADVHPAGRGGRGEGVWPMRTHALWQALS